ncbi:MAG: hypothetical protein M9894_38320 [Planctomycetes bacterium]|nr:hypothetical protein [Planctomycetota bacterium]
MNRLTRLSLSAGCAAAAALAAPAALAGALSSRHGRVTIEDLRLAVHAEDGLVTTELEQVLRNDAGDADEAIYDLPLPERATFAGLSVWVDGREVQGEVVARARAEAIYTDVTGSDVTVRREARRQAPALQSAPTAPRRQEVTLLEPLRLEDPGLLELLDGRTLRLRLAPVPAGGTYRVKLRWVEPATVHRGRGRVVVPLAPAAGAGAAVADRLRATVLVAGGEEAALGRVDCPSHPEAAVADLAEGVAARVDLSAAQTSLDRDLEVAWDVVAPAARPTLTVAAARDDDGVGTALLSLTPWLPPGEAAGPRDVVLVLDASPGVGRRAAEARAALGALAGALGPDDRLAVVVLDLAARAWPPALTPCTPAHRQAALAALDRAAWRHPADPRALAPVVARLQQATPGPRRPLDLVLVTDAGLSRDDALLRALEAPARAAAVRVSAVELGADRAVRAPLGRLARATGGVALPAGADPRAAAAQVTEHLRAPALFAPRLTLEGVALTEVHPAVPPPVLTAGTQVHLLGRYPAPGTGRLTLEGTLASGRAVRWTLPVELPARGRHPDVSRLWAQAAAEQVEADLRRPGLTAAARAALAQDLERVSLAGPVLTRATALLVLEGEGMFRRYGVDRRNRDLVGREEAAQDARLDALERRIERRRREAEQAQQVVAQAPPRKVELWQGGGLGGLGGGGGGGGAGEPVLLLLAAAAGASAWRRRRAA